MARRIGSKYWLEVLTGDAVRSEVTWPTIPAMVRDAAQRRGEAEAIVDGDRRVDLRGAAPPGRRRRACAGRVGHRARRSRRGVGAELARVDRRRARASRPRAACWCRSTPGSEAQRRRTSSRASGARALVTVRGFLDTDYPALLASAGVALPALEQTILLAGEPDGASIAWTDFVERGRGVADDELDARVESIGPDDPSDVVFTSGTTGNPKGVVMTHVQTLRAYLDWCDWADLRPGDRYLIANPFFHIFGYKAGCLACLMRGATIFPLPVFDAGVALELVERERITVLPGPADDLPLAPRPSRPGAPRHLEPARRRDRRRRHPRGADPARARRAPVRAHPHRLRAHRSRHRHRLPPRRRLRAHRHARSACRGPASR